MRHSARVAGLAVFGVLLAGCDATETPSEPTSGALAEFHAGGNVLGGPDAPGRSGVFRGETGLVTFTTDPVRDYLAAHFQADDIFFCGGDGDFELSRYNAVNNKEDVVRVISQLRDAPIFLYRLSTFPPPGDPDECRAFAEDWLYQGIHSINFQDNDFFGAAAGANTFKWLGHGTVFDPDGNRRQYSEVQHALFGADGSFAGWRSENIRVAGNDD